MTPTILARVGSTLTSIRPPVRRTLTTRKRTAQQVRSNLATYLNVAGQDANVTAVQRLAWSVAHLERLTYLETSGQFGNPNLTAARVLERMSNR